MTRIDSARPNPEPSTPAAPLVALHRRVASDQRSFLLGLLRWMLVPLALAYAAIATLRNALYSCGVFRVRKAGVRTISVGNLTTGGTGKTPLVISLARAALRAGLRPAVLLRGYRRGSAVRSDEATLLERSLPGVPVITGPDRVRSAAIATAHGATILILDDGFQHRRLARDCDVVLLDARDPFGGGWQLPRGHRREPLCGLKRAHLVVLTRADRAGGASAPSVRSAIDNIRALVPPRVPILFESHRPTEVVDRRGVVRMRATALAGRRLLVFSGIGDPATLVETLGAIGATVVGSRVFVDHHEFSPSEIDSLHAAAKHLGAEFIVTTEKDIVRIGEIASDVDLLALRIEAEVDPPLDPAAVSAALGFEWPIQI